MLDPLPDPFPRLPPADFVDPVIEAYKQDVDVTLLRENLRLSIAERWAKAESFHRSIREWRGAAIRNRQRSAEILP